MGSGYAFIEKPTVRYLGARQGTHHVVAVEYNRRKQNKDPPGGPPSLKIKLQAQKSSLIFHCRRVVCAVLRCRRFVQ